MNNDKNNMFLVKNPHILKLLDNDHSLKGISPVSELQKLVVAGLTLPRLYTELETSYTLQDFRVENYVRFFLNMVVNGKLSSELHYTDCYCSEQDIECFKKNIDIAYELASSRYIEYFSGLHGFECKVNMRLLNGTITDFVISIKLIENYHNSLVLTQDFLKLALYVINDLKFHKKIYLNMPDYIKARVLYNWVVLHTNYDLTFKPRSYSGLSALLYGSAVCQGYTSLYNLLCKLCSVNVTGVPGYGKNSNSFKEEKHIWTCALFSDSPMYRYIDVTWGSPIFMDIRSMKHYGVDTSLFCDFNYFDMPYSEFIKEHNWDRDIYG